MVDIFYNLNYLVSKRTKKKYLESSDSNIANIGAIFLGKSAKENMGCVQCKMEAEVRLLVVPLLKVDETL